MLFSQILNKDVFTQEDFYLGQITQLRWQKKSICLFITTKCAFCCEKLKLVKGKIVAQGVKQLQTALAEVMGKQLYDTNGIALGKVVDAQISSTGKMQKVLLQNSTYNVGQIVANGDIILVKTNCPIKRKNTKATKQKHNAEQNTSRPRRKYGDFSFLIGRRVDKNIQNFLGETMIKKGRIITKEIYIQAKRFGKLTELCLHSQ